MSNIYRKCHAPAPDLRVRGAGMCAFAWMPVPGSISPAQAGENSTL